ncbi:SOS response-associated peptidase family protein, partial [Acinetobacter baumannii]
MVPIIMHPTKPKDEAEAETRYLEYAKWGFTPFWSKDPKKSMPMINARSETIAESKMFKHSFTKKRCIIPADSFYEWKRMGTAKLPMRI